MITNEIIERIISRFDKVLGHERRVALFGILQREGAVVSGSAVLQCILDEMWQFSDIDIFVPTACGATTVAGGPELTAWCKEMCRYAFYREEAKYAEMTLHFSTILDVSTFIFDSGIDTIDQIQLIYTTASKGDMEAYVTNHFDFDFCKNVFSIVDGQPRLFVHNPTSVKNKTGNFCNRGGLIRSMLRAVKYRERGFTITASNRVVRKLLLDEQRKYADDARRREFYHIDFTEDSLLCYNGTRIGLVLDGKGPSIGIGRILQECSRIRIPGYKCYSGCVFCSFGLDHFGCFTPGGEERTGRMEKHFVVSLFAEKQAWDAVVGMCMALFPLFMPSYCLLWISRLLPVMYDSKGAEFIMTELQTLNMIVSINESARKRFHEQREEKVRKVKLDK